MPESFGARLRRQREEQNIALVTIAEETKIKASLLEALERDDVSQWPSGIFRRAHVRSYAYAIGLNPDDVLREFLEKYPDPADNLDPFVATAATSEGSPAAGGPPTRFHYLVDSAMASLSRVRRSSAAAASVIAGDPRSDVPDRWASPVFEPNAGTDRAPDTSTVDPAEGSASMDYPACSESPASDPDLLAFADLCTELGRIERADQMQPLLQKVARILDAAGLMVWVWDETAGELRPALVHGYSDKVVAQLPAVTEDADNVTAAAFRSAEACTTAGSEHANGALVVPLLTPGGCGGVLALELRRGRERANSVRAVATIFAALLAQMIGDGRRGHVRPSGTVTVPPVGDVTRRVLRVNVPSDGHARMRVPS